MKRLRICLLLLISTITATAQDWQLRKNESGIMVSTRDNGTPYQSVQVVTLVSTNLPEAISIIMNVERFPEWIFKCRETAVLERKSDDVIIHSQVNSVPFLTDRYMVIKLEKKENELGEVQISQTSLDDYSIGETSYIRIKSMQGLWELSPIQGGIQIRYTITVDPGPGLPKRLVNKGLIDGPFQTMLALKKLLEEKEITVE